MSTTDELIQNATTLIRVGKNAEAKKVLSQVVKQEPDNAKVWLLLSQVAQDQEQAIYCLNKALEIEPFNKPARMWLKTIKDVGADGIRPKYEKVAPPIHQPPEQRQAKATNLLPIVLLVIVIIMVMVVWVLIR